MSKFFSAITGRGDDSTRLDVAARDALRSNSMSPFAALTDFRSTIIGDGGLGGALLAWANGQGEELCLAYLRSVAASMQNDRPRPAAPAAAPATAPRHSPGPSVEQIAASKRGAKRMLAAIYNEDFDGRPVGTISWGEMKTLVNSTIPARMKKRDHQNALDVRLLAIGKEMLEYGKPASELNSISDVVPVRVLQGIFAKNPLPEKVDG